MDRNEEMIELKNNISVAQVRDLLEVTQIIGKALTEDEFLQVISFYGKVANRLLKAGVTNE
ncbi:hypothetical protein [Terrisporobacter petrolearius]|uniref:hypothetical protein n=1 Tax=Terrisporobacter petrolearius TaxID=1460447 RepID=UPI0031CCCB52